MFRTLGSEKVAVFTIFRSDSDIAVDSRESTELARATDCFNAGDVSQREALPAHRLGLAFSKA